MIEKNNEYIEINKNFTFCPPNEKEIGEKHPRVYLKLNEKKASICPYCGTKYKQIIKKILKFSI